MLTYFFRAIFRPAARNASSGFLRSLFRLPVVFDVVSTTLQLRDLHKINRLKAEGLRHQDNHFDKVTKYNLGVTVGKKISRTRRVEEYYEIITIPRRNISSEKLLIIGPRNIQEIFIAWTFGFSWANISGIDLYSTNPKIIEMNMEEMFFPNNSFDSITMANTLSYANSTRKALAEVARVLKPGGRFAFSATYDPNDIWKEDSISGEVIKKYLDEFNLQVYVHYSKDKINSFGRRQTSHTFAVEKKSSEEIKFDTFHL